jgi:hypothetical protein
MSPVPHPREYLPVLDRIATALDATCDALMTLQSLDLLATAPDGKPVDGHVARAISHLRQATDELRDAHMQGQTGLALGFVLARDCRTPSDDEELDQSSPRRTA